MTTMTVRELDRLPTRFNEVQHRAAEIKDLDPDAGTLRCRLVPYDVEVELDHGLYESFAPKAFERAANAPTRMKMWFEHAGPLVGHCTAIEDKPDGCWADAKFANTLAAQEARELARNGTLTDVSITFKAMKDWVKLSRRNDGLHVRHARGFLMGFALVGIGAYAEHAFIASTRDAEPSPEEIKERRRQEQLAYWESLRH